MTPPDQQIRPEPTDLKPDLLSDEAAFDLALDFLELIIQASLKDAAKVKAIPEWLRG